jgi:hypothetical protein
LFFLTVADDPLTETPFQGSKLFRSVSCGD